MPLVKVFLPPSGPVLSAKTVSDAVVKHFKTTVDNVNVLIVRLPSDDASWPPSAFFDIRAKRLDNRTQPGAFSAFEQEMQALVAQHYSGFALKTIVRIELFDEHLKCKL